MLDTLTRLARSDTGRGVLVAAVAGVFLALTNAFGSDSIGLTFRLIYWVVLMVAATLWASLCIKGLSAAEFLPPSPVGQFLIIVAAISGPLTLAIWLGSGLAFAGEIYPLSTLGGFAWRVVLITAVMSAIGMMLERRKAETRPPETAPPRFLERLPLKLKGATIHAVESEDHYLRVHTDRGSDLILMRLSDAVAELEGLEGAQTHRSWWVAREAVTGVKRGDGRATLTLKGGLEVPVSRTHASALREAGWY